jgi:N-acyl-D-amino-acid deacylase
MKSAHLLYRSLATTLVLIAAGGSVKSAPASERDFDVLIKNGRVVDGTGTSSYVADVGIADGKIAAIGRLDEKRARKKVDAQGLVVAPGFIDMMGQTATPMLRDGGVLPAS